MSYFIVTYGCAMNYSDSERIAVTLEKIGYKLAKNEGSADLIIFNACSVRQSAIDRVYGKLNDLKLITHNLKHKKRKYILTGCILKKDKEKLKDKFDLIFNIKDLAKLPRLLKKLSVISCHSREGGNPRKIWMSMSSPNMTKLIPISTGCNNYCSYCVVPYARGPEICQPASQIIRDAKHAIKNGAKEIWLLGQNVNSYQFIDKNSSSEALAKEDGNTITFPKLLKIINALPGDFWIKFISSHPKDMSDDLIGVVAKCEKVCKYIHLPIQSGNNTILQKMNRRYTITRYKNLIKKIRTKIPDAAISTDIIVGFPGETKKQFTNSAKLMREIGFDMAYLAQYSPRSQTAAFKLKDNVPKQEKKQREYILNEILKKTALQNNQKYIGKTVKMLIEKIKSGFAFGKTASHKNVKINLPMKSSASAGDFVAIKIVSVKPWNLLGKIIL